MRTFVMCGIMTLMTACSPLSSENSTRGNAITPYSLPAPPPRLAATLTESEAVICGGGESLSCRGLVADSFREAAYPYFTKLRDFTRTSDNDERMIGKQVEEQMRETFKDRIDIDRAWLTYVTKLGRSLVSRVRRTNVDYHFHVIRDDDVNAFSIPWGGIYVHTGLLDALENEAQLVAILAHEIQHVDLGHCMSVYQLFFKIPESMRTSFAANIALFAGKLIKHPFNPTAEIEADTKGIDLIYSFGYSPLQYVRFWDKESTPAPDSSPRSETRLTKAIQRFREEVDNALSRHPHEAHRSCMIKKYIAGLCDRYPVERAYVGKWNLSEKKTYFEVQK